MYVCTPVCLFVQGVGMLSFCTLRKSSDTLPFNVDFALK